MFAQILHLKEKIDMAFAKALINIGLIFIAAATAFPTGEDSRNDSSHVAINYRLPDNVTPVHYSLKLIPYIEKGNFTFDGESSVVIRIRRATRDLSLHALE